MLKILIILAIFATLSGCYKNKSGDHFHSTKNHNAMDVNDAGFVYEAYASASETECPNGGWKVAKAQKLDDEKTVSLSKTLLSCLDLSPNFYATRKNTETNPNIQRQESSPHSLTIYGGSKEFDWHKLPSTVTELAIHGSELENLNGIAAASQLERLNLSGNRLKDIEGLQHLTKIRWIDLSDNQINNFAPLINLSYAKPEILVISDLEQVPRKIFFQ